VPVLKSQFVSNNIQKAESMAECPRQIDGLDLIQVEDGFVIHEEEKDRVHYLNHIAAVVLTMCDGQTSTEEITKQLQDHFGLDESPEKDVADILNRFLDEGLVTLATCP
jgi:hypothetical protein